MEKAELKYRNWMVTIMTDKEGKLELPTIDAMKHVFSEEGNTWVFQEEIHENAEMKGKTHYQCCLVTKIRKRKLTLLKTLSEGLGHPVERIRVEKMNGSLEQGIAYCSKGETKMDDTHFSEDLKSKYDYSDIDFLYDKEKRFPWQNAILEELFNSVPTDLKVADDRTIIWITDHEGCTGKSKLVKFICAHNNNSVKLGFGSAGQTRSAVVSVGAKELFIIDIPRTLGDDDSMNSLISCLEDIKNGFVSSNFYGKYESSLFKNPHIVVFSNMICPQSKMSSDRWKNYFIVDKQLLTSETVDRMRYC